MAAAYATLLALQAIELLFFAGQGAVIGRPEEIQGAQAGAIVRKPSLLLVGERGPEAVVPLERYEEEQKRDLHLTLNFTPTLFEAVKTTPEEIIVTVTGDAVRKGRIYRVFKEVLR